MQQKLGEPPGSFVQSAAYHCKMRGQAQGSNWFWKAWTLGGVTLSVLFAGRLAVGSHPPAHEVGQVLPAKTKASAPRASSPAPPVADSSPEWLLSRLNVAETGSELCQLLQRLPEADDAQFTYAITSVLERTHLRSVRACATAALTAQPSAPAQSWLIDLADDPDPDVHQKALDALATRDDGLCRASVSDAAQSSDPSIRVNAVMALLKARRGEAFGAAKELLRTLDDPTTLSALIDALGESGDARALPIFRELIDHGERDAHLHAISAVGVLGVASGSALLEPFLHLGSDDEFRAAALALAKLAGEPALVPRLVTALHGGNAARRALAVSILAQLESPAAKIELVGVLHSDEPMLVTAALRYLRRTHDTLFEAPVAELARHGNAWTRPAAISALAQLGTPGALDALRGLSAGDSGDPEEFALHALGAFPEASEELRARRIQKLKLGGTSRENNTALFELAHDPSDAAQAAVLDFVEHGSLKPEVLSRVLTMTPAKTADRLLEHLRHSTEPAARLALISVLAERNDPKFADDLRRATGDADSATRQAAIRGLVNLGDERAGELLSTLARDPAPEARQTAIELLGSRADPASLTLLERLSSDSATEVAVPALAALAERFPERAANTARRLFQAGGAETRANILGSMLGMRGAWVTSMYETGLADRDDQTALRAVELATANEGPAAAQRLLGVVLDTSRSQELRAAAANALHSLGGSLERSNRSQIDALREHDVEEASCGGVL